MYLRAIENILMESASCMPLLSARCVIGSDLDLEKKRKIDGAK